MFKIAFSYLNEKNVPVRLLIPFIRDIDVKRLPLINFVKWINT